MYAVQYQYNNPIFFKLLLDVGIDINETDSRNQTALTYAFNYCQNLELLDILSNYSGPLETNIHNIVGRTPICYLWANNNISLEKIIEITDQINGTINTY